MGKCVVYFIFISRDLQPVMDIISHIVFIIKKYVIPYTYVILDKLDMKIFH